MTINKLAGTLAGLAFFATANAAHAQMGMGPTTPFSIEARGHVAFPMGDLNVNDGVNTGFGGTVQGMFQATPMLGIYAAYSYTTFGSDSDPDFGDANVDVTDKGVSAGVRAGFGSMMMMGASPYIQGGAVYHKLGIRASGGGASFGSDTDSKLGFEVGGGLAFPLGPRVSVTPGVNYTRFNASDSDSGDFNVSHLDVGVGLNFRI